MTDAEIAFAVCPGAPLDEGIAGAVKVLRDAGTGELSRRSQSYHSQCPPASVDA